jgi:phosphoenolpyruvate carboxylase
MKNKENLKKKIHIVTNSIVKINLSNLPNLSHFREIGENFRKFNRNPSATKVENFHTRIFMKEPSTPQQVGQYITGDITTIKQSGWPITTTPSERKRVNQQKCFFMANNRVGERPR